MFSEFLTLLSTLLSTLALINFDANLLLDLQRKTKSMVGKTKKEKLIQFGLKPTRVAPRTLSMGLWVLTPRAFHSSFLQFSSNVFAVKQKEENEESEKKKSVGKMEKRAAYSKLKHGYVFHAVFSRTFCSYSALSFSPSTSLSLTLYHCR